MNVAIKYFKKRRILCLFLGIILISGLITGLILAINSKNDFLPILNNYQNNIKGLTLPNLLIHFSILAFLLISSLIFLNIPLFIGFIFIEGINCGFLLTIFTITYKLKGFIFAMLFLSFTNILFLVFLILIFFKSLDITKNIINHFISKKDNELVLFKLILTALILILIALISDFILFLISPKILNIFHFLLT